ncbi:hypothetical protein K1719_018408 [Acacia pycnantha]|nr:hypothetical protein K1719_018408 [Acacia pycnantha]
MEAHGSILSLKLLSNLTAEAPFESGERNVAGAIRARLGGKEEEERKTIITREKRKKVKEINKQGTQEHKRIQGARRRLKLSVQKFKEEDSRSKCHKGAKSYQAFARISGVLLGRCWVT